MDITAMQLDAIKAMAAKRRTAAREIGGDTTRIIPFTSLEERLILACKRHRINDQIVADMLGASPNAVRTRVNELRKNPAG